MVNIFELKTTQTAAMKIVIDEIYSLITDANLVIYPYYIEDGDNSDNSDNSDPESSHDTPSDKINILKSKKNKSIDETDAPGGKPKQLGGIVLKEVNKPGKILVYMRLDSDKFDVYKYNYHKKN